jgi:hypothetical protein
MLHPSISSLYVNRKLPGKLDFTQDYARFARLKTRPRAWPVPEAKITVQQVHVLFEAQAPISVHEPWNTSTELPKPRHMQPY